LLKRAWAKNRFVADHNWPLFQMSGTRLVAFAMGGEAFSAAAIQPVVR